jgi:hypothetical protein
LKPTPRSKEKELRRNKREEDTYKNKNNLASLKNKASKRVGTFDMH